MNSPAMQWLKSNVLIVVFAVVIVAAFIALPLVSAGMNQEVEAKLNARRQLEQQITALRNTPIELRDPTLDRPLEQQAAIINPAALNEFREHTTERVAEANRVVEAAVEHNSKSRGVLMPALFPTPRRSEIQVLTNDMSARLREAYENLLVELNAGSPPSLAEMKDTLIAAQSQFIQIELNKSSTADLTPQELQRLRDYMSGRRLQEAQERAQSISTYAGISAFNIPGWTYGEGDMPSVGELFEWQWDYWATHDIVMALAAANADAQSVLDAPVKRIISLTPTMIGGADDERDRGRGSGGGNATSGGGGGGGGGPILSGGGEGATGGGNRNGGNAGRGNTGNTGTPAPAQPQGESADPSREVPRDFTISMTGRSTNPLYDVRYYRLHMVVDSARLKEVIDAIGRENFMTAISMEMWPADPYDDLQSGLVYGPEPTSEVVLVLETVWLREWTTDFMPDETKQALKIPTGTPPAGQPANPS